MLGGFDAVESGATSDNDWVGPLSLSVLDPCEFSGYLFWRNFWDTGSLGHQYIKQIMAKTITAIAVVQLANTVRPCR